MTTMTDTETYAIVLAKVTMGGIRLTGRYKDRLSQVPETEAAPVAKAMVWCTKPVAKDYESARAFAAREGYTAFTFTHDVFTLQDPLAIARAKVMA